LSDELRAAVRQAADDQDVRWALDLIEHSDPSNRAHGTIRDLLQWLDDGSEVITQRLVAWLRADDDRLTYEARRLIDDHPLSAGAFRERARVLVREAASDELEDAIIAARHPTTWSGTRHRYWRALRKEFATWTDDPDEAIADIGRAAIEYYERLLEREDTPEEGATRTTTTRTRPECSSTPGHPALASPFLIRARHSGSAAQLPAGTLVSGPPLML